MLDDFTHYRDDLVENLGQLKKLAIGRNESGMAESLETLIEKSQEGRFYIACFGGFSSGKSTFVNALLGDKVLPARTTPTTATLNYVSHGEKQARVLFKTKEEIEKDRKSGLEGFTHLDPSFKMAGKELRIELDKLDVWIAGEDKAGYVRQVEVKWPAPLLSSGVVFIDSPGTDSIIASHREITYRFVEQADAILFFILGHRPFTEADYHFLADIRAIREHIKEDKFFFVINAIDGIEEQPVTEVEDYVRRILVERSGIKNPQIFCLSSRAALYLRKRQNKALDPNEEKSLARTLAGLGACEKDGLKKSGFPELENRLSEFLMREKGRRTLANAYDRVKTFLEGIESSLLLERKSTEATLADLTRKIEGELMPLVATKKKEAAQLGSEIRGQLQEFDDLLDFNGFAASLRTAAESALEQDGEARNAVIQREINSWTYAARQKFSRKANKIADDMIGRGNAIVSTVRDHIGKSFKIEMPKQDIRFGGSLELDLSDLAMPSGAKYDSSPADSGLGMGLLGGLLAFLIPGGLGFIGGALLGGLTGVVLDNSSQAARSSRSIMASVRSKLGGRIESSVTKMKADYQSAVSDFGRQLTGTVTSAIDGVLSDLEGQLEQMLKRKRDEDEKARVRELELARVDKEAARIRDRMLKMREEVLKLKG